MKTTLQAPPQDTYDQALAIAKKIIGGGIIQEQDGKFLVFAVDPTPTTFREQIAKNISAKITELKKDGITGMGLPNLAMVTKTPSPALAGAPAGPAGYRAIFREVALSKPITRRFLITTDY